MMGFNFFGSMTKLNFTGRERSNSKGQKPKDQYVLKSNQEVGEVKKGEANYKNEEIVLQTVEGIGKSSGRRGLETNEDGLGTGKVVAGVSRLDVKDKDELEGFSNGKEETEMQVKENQATAKNHLAEDEEAETRDKFEMHNTTFYKVLTKSFYEKNLNILKPFQKKDDDNTLKSSPKRTKKTTRTLRERKLVISSPQNFQRIENEMTVLVRREAENMGLGTLKKSASLGNLLRDSGDFSDRFGMLGKRRVEFSSVGDLTSDDDTLSADKEVKNSGDKLSGGDNGNTDNSKKELCGDLICLTCGSDHSVPTLEKGRVVFTSKEELTGNDDTNFLDKGGEKSVDKSNRSDGVATDEPEKELCVNKIGCLTCGGDHGVPETSDVREGGTSDELKREDLQILENGDISSESVLSSSEENIDQVVEEYLRSNLVTMRDKSQSTPELLKSINQFPKERIERPSENKFPLVDENVEVRRKPSIQRNRISKTTDFDLGRRRQDSPINPKNFDIRGIVKFQLPHNTIITKLNQEYVAYENENFYRINEKTKAKVLLSQNVLIKTARYISSKSKESKEVELKDTQNLSYILYFDSIKYAKHFMENEKIQVYVCDNKVTIKKTLLRFLGKRSSREILEKKGIYKNEQIFGNTLRDIHIKGAANSGSPVPLFIYRVIELIERLENIKSLGLYRTSGNLATIQKIRFEVDNGRLEILDHFSKDPDVLTGSLKLFFRELKEPLISCEVCEKLMEITKLDPKQMTSKDHHKIRSTLVKNLPEANIETFYVVMRHLLEVIKYKEYNKMDSYNLAVCWGPSMIFSVHGGNAYPSFELSKDIVTQSHDATRLVDFLLGYYELYPSELEGVSKRPESVTEKILALKRQESRDSVESSDSSKSQKKSSSNLSLSIDEITKKLVEIIEPNLSSEGLYKKPGSPDKTNKIMKKLNKKKIHELDKYKTDVNEVTDALKKYLREQEGLVSGEVVELVLKATSDNPLSYLEPITRRKVTALIEETPRKDTLIFLLRHVAKVIEHQARYQVSKKDVIDVWTNVLNYQKKCQVSHEDFSKFLTVAVEVFNDNLPDIVRSSFNNNGSSPNRNEIMGEVVKQIKHQQERDRNSRYDNVDCEIAGEASILDDKTEQTKL